MRGRCAGCRYRVCQTVKLSVYSEPGFLKVSRAVVVMDGHRLKHVTRVDTCTGVAWVHATNPDGTVQVDRARQCVVERKIYGPMRVFEIQP